MKKLLTGLLAMLTCFACATAVACGDDNKDNSSSTPINTESPDTGSSDTGSSDTGSSDTASGDEDDEVADAAAYLEELYRDKDAETRADYEILPAIWGYNIAWSVTLPDGVTAGVSIKTENDKVIVDVDELLDADLTYVLTGVVSNEAGQSVTVSFTRVVKAAPSMIPKAITEAPKAGVAYKYHVYQSTLSKDLYFAGGMAATYYFSTTEDSAAAVDVYAEYVADSTTEFYLYFNHTTDGKQYFGVKVSDDGAHDNIVYTSTPISTFVWNATLGTVTTHLEATKNNGGPNDFYFGNYGDKTTISASYTSYAGGAGNNVGHLVTMVDKNSITPEKKVAEAKEGLTLASTEITGAKEVELPTSRHADVIVTWAISENTYASIVDGKIVTTNPAADTTVTLTATLTCGDVTDTKEFTLTLKHASDLPAFDTEITIPQANAIGEAQATNVLTEGKYYVSGVVTEVKNTQYGNLYIEDAEGNRLYVYGCYDVDGTNRYDAMANAPQVGDTVKLYSAITSYNGSAQLKNAWVVEWTAGTPDDSTPDDSTGDSTTDSDTGSGDVQPTLYAVVPEADKPYVFGMTQANCDNKVYYLAGGMDGFYMATTTDANKAIKTYLEATTGGYYFYTYVGETKTYINMVVSGTHVNGAYEATASTVYTIDEENKTLIAVVNDDDYWFGTRNDNTYTTMGPCKVSYNGFYGVFYTDEEPTPVTTYTLTLVNGTETTSKLAEGAALQLPALEAEGKTFLGWFDGEGNAAPATMPAAALTLTAKWEVNVYTLTIKQEGEEDKAFTFGVEKVENRTAYLPSELTDLLAANLPANFKWAEAVPETFELKDYIFTIISAEVPKFTLTLVNGEETTTNELAEGATFELPTPAIDGKSFLGWFNGETKVEKVTMPAAALTLTAKWEVNVYTLTIVNGETSTEFTFGVEKVADRTAYLPSELKGILEANLPADAIWVEAVPETFELKDYTFTAVIPPIYENVAYKFYVNQVNIGTELYITGAVSGRYLSTTMDASEGVDVYAERVDGGYKFYILVDSAKQYINLYSNSENKISLNFAADSTTVFAHNDTLDIWVTAFGGKDYYLGTYNDFNTISASETKYINASNNGVSQFPARFATADEAAAMMPTANDKIAHELSKLAVTETVTGAKEITLASQPALFTEVVISWAVTAGSEIASIENGKLTITNPAEDTTVTVVATLTCGEVTETKAFTIAVAHKAAGDPVAVEATLSFADKANRTSYSTSQQVWEQNGIKLTNDKGTSTSNVGDYADPARFYKSSTVTIECARMTQIVIDCTTAGDNKYITPFLSDIKGDGVTVTQDGKKIIVTFAQEVDSFSFVCATGQSRASSITVTYNT